jgi:TRAP-type C4-dicarboxylate transport system permease small subunit
MADFRQVLTVLGTLERTFIRFLSDAIRLIAVGSLTLILLFTAVNATMRYLFDAPIDGTIDIIRLILMPLTVWFFASALQYNDGRSYGDRLSQERRMEETFAVDASERTREEGNITVDFLANRLSEQTNELIKLLYLPVIILVLGGFVRNSWTAAMQAWVGGFWTQGTVQLPIWLPRFIITFGVLFLVLELTRQFLHLLAKKSREAYVRLEGRRERR